MKELLSTIWNMPASELLTILLVCLLISIAFSAIPLFYIFRSLRSANKEFDANKTRIRHSIQKWERRDGRR